MNITNTAHTERGQQDRTDRCVNLHDHGRSVGPVATIIQMAWSAAWCRPSLDSFYLFLVVLSHHVCWLSGAIPTLHNISPLGVLGGRHRSPSPLPFFSLSDVSIFFYLLRIFCFFLLLLLKSFVMFLMNEFPVVFLPTKKRKCFSCRAYVLRFVTEETCCVAVWSSSFFYIIGFSPPAPEDQFVRPEGLESDDPLITNESPERK
jgi:hypothetical protein